MVAGDRNDLVAHAVVEFLTHHAERYWAYRRTVGYRTFTGGLVELCLTPAV
jgi:hypothetical protein